MLLPSSIRSAEPPPGLERAVDSVHRACHSCLLINLCVLLSILVLRDECEIKLT